MYERFRVWRGAVALMWLLAVAAVHAQAPAAAADLYAAVVPVTEQSNAELRRGAGIGLREVLVRVSGRSDAVRSAALSDALGDAGRYLDQYRYDRNPAADSGAAPWLLQLRFSANSVAQLLRGAGLPVWVGNRPALQLWLATEEGGRRSVVDEQSPLAPALRAQAQRRGLALHFPRDARALGADEIWQAGAVDARAAALAGSGEIVVLGRLSQQSGRCSSAWLLPGAAAPLPADGDAADTCFAAGFDRIADALAQQYAAAASSDANGTTVLRVAGIDSFGAYAALLGYLKQIGAIKAATLQQVDGDVVQLQLKLEGSAEQLARQLALDNRLAPDSGAAAAQSATLHYRWQAARG